MDALSSGTTCIASTAEKQGGERWRLPRREGRESEANDGDGPASASWMTDTGAAVRTSARLSVRHSATTSVRGCPPYCAATHPSGGAPARGCTTCVGRRSPFLTSNGAAPPADPRLAAEPGESREYTATVPSSAESAASPCLRAMRHPECVAFTAHSPTVSEDHSHNKTTRRGGAPPPSGHAREEPLRRTRRTVARQYGFHATWLVRRAASVLPARTSASPSAALRMSSSSSGSPPHSLRSLSRTSVSTRGLSVDCAAARRRGGAMG